jgi:hypothetical protein
VTAKSLPGVHVVKILPSGVGVRGMDASASSVVFVSRSAEIIAPARGFAGASMDADPVIKPWSDDYSDVVGAIWRRMRPAH